MIGEFLEAKTFMLEKANPVHNSLLDCKDFLRKIGFLESMVTWLFRQLNDISTSQLSVTSAIT